jgi:hypothetical protein
MDRRTAYTAFLQAVGDCFFDQIVVAAPRPDEALTRYDVHVRRVEVQNQLRPDIDHLAKRLSDDPASDIRVPPRKGALKDETKELLNFSLLDPDRRKRA